MTLASFPLIFGAFLWRKKVQERNKIKAFNTWVLHANIIISYNQH